MNIGKKILLIIAINILYCAMSYYIYTILVVEYNNYIIRSKIYLDTLGLEEANLLSFGNIDLDQLTDQISIISSKKDNIYKSLEQTQEETKNVLSRQNENVL